MRVIGTSLLVALGVLATACGGGSGKKVEEPDAPVGHPVLPDIAPAPPIDTQMQGKDGKWEIEFSSILVNVGDGDFILRAKRDGKAEWHVEQDIPYSTSGASVVPTPAKVVWGGDGHNHWHISRVATNRLVRLDDDGKPAPGEGRVDSKVGFCFYDFSKDLEKGPAKAQYVHESCGHEDDDTIGMGLSSGWGDTYVLTLPGQSIDVTDVPDGRYRLFAEADEAGWFHEVTRDNNVTWIDLELSTKGGARFAKVVAVGPKPK